MRQALTGRQETRPETASPESELQHLYFRYKTLALSCGAALLIGETDDRLEHETQALLEDCRAGASGQAPAALAPSLAACASAAEDLHRLASAARAERLELPLERLTAARASHSRLRSERWNVLPCEYVPCAASPAGRPGSQGR